MSTKHIEGLLRQYDSNFKATPTVVDTTAVDDSDEEEAQQGTQQGLPPVLPLTEMI